MRIKRFLGGLALFVAVLTVGSSAWALSYADHVSLAPNGQGDVLIYPLFVATDGWESNISVINTSSTQSIVAKIVFRSYAYSQELMGFLIYLSPSDMWVGTLKRGVKDKDGKVGVGVYSVDSSALYDSGIDPATMPDPFARDEEGKRLEKLFVTPVVATGCAVDLNTMGYVTVLEAWSARINFTAEELADKQKRGKRISADYLAAATTTPINALSGSIDLSYPNGGAAATAAVALKDWKNMTKLSVGNTTALGKDLANNNQREMDAALSKGPISVPFDNGAATVETWHAFTFPTKGTRITAVSPLCILTNDSDYFRAAGSVGFLIDEYDIDEMHANNPFSPVKALTLPYEFYWVETGTAVFKQGWMQYRLPGSTATDLPVDRNLSGQPLAYTGAPLIPLVINFINDGMFPKMTIKNASYADSTILGGAVGGFPTVPIPGYQYSSASVPTR